MRQNKTGYAQLMCKPFRCEIGDGVPSGFFVNFKVGTGLAIYILKRRACLFVDRGTGFLDTDFNKKLIFLA